MNIEKITSLDDLKALGYFETIRSVFFTKLLLMTNHTDGQKLIINVERKALKKGNNELMLNFQEDIITTLFISSWIIFELIIKDLTKNDYALTTDDISADYKKNVYGLSVIEKKNLDLFYYIRNAIVHYNGAYYSCREIDYTYEGFKYFSKGHEGTKIFIPNTEVAFKMHLDIEDYAYKAWDNYHKKKTDLTKPNIKNNM